MKFIRKLYFNPIVNRLNKNLKIRQKSYLAFLLVSIMIVLFSVYVLFTYSEIKKREFQFQSLYTIQNCNNSLIKLLKNKLQYASSRDEIVQNINKLKRSVQYLEDHNIWLRSRVKEINNTLYTIENLSFLTNRSGVVVIDQSKNQEIAQINDIIDDLMVYNGKIENNITIISSQTETMFRQKNIMIYLIMLTGLFGSIIIANFISYRITNPIEKLKDNIKILENGNYNLDSNF
ncbi:MAG: hypothetical protein C0597_11560 [Marinilabiliales bacterium]|nr:MAG: hypothetical protein C0597_11560 [Marinilabiliales bacterium]